MTLQDEAQDIYNQLINQYKPKSSPWLSFDQKNPHCLNMIAAQQFVKKINDRIKANPELLTVMLSTERSIKAAPLFLIFQEWVSDSFSYIDKSYGKQFYDWLVSEKTLVPVDITAELTYGYPDNIVRLLESHNLLLQEFVDVNKLIISLQRLPFSNVILQRYSQKLLGQHFSKVKISEHNYYDKNMKSYTEEQRHRACVFINEMRIMSLITDNTEMSHTEYDGYNQTSSKSTATISYLSAKPGYEALKISANDLIKNRLITVLNTNTALVDIERIQACINVYENEDSNKYGYKVAKDPAKSAEFANFIKYELLETLNKPWSPECKTSLLIFTMQQAIIAKNIEYILSALEHLNLLLQKTNDSDEWYRIFSVGFAALRSSGSNKAMVAEKILEAVADRFGSKHIVRLQQRLVENNEVNPACMLFSMQFVTKPDVETRAMPAKRMRLV